MPGTNDFQIFAGAGGANVITQAQYLALAAKATGFQSGIATSAQLNKVWRQSSIMSAMLGQFIADNANVNAVDDGSLATLEANFTLAVQAINQVKLTSNLNLYVNPSTGNDLNTGTSPSTAFRTIQHAFDVGFSNYNYNRNALIVNLAAGTYTAGVSLLGMPVGCPVVNLVGNVVTPSSVQINVTNGNCIITSVGTLLNVSGVTLSASGTATLTTSLGYGVITSQSYCNMQNCVFGSCGTIQGTSVNGGILTLGNCTFTGTSANGLYAQNTGTITMANTSATYSGAVYTGANISAIILGSFIGIGCLFAGSCTGVRFNVSYDSVIQTAGGGINFFPGSIAGNVSNATGGFYL
jgi:hypothetical protein